MVYGIIMKVSCTLAHRTRLHTAPVRRGVHSALLARPGQFPSGRSGSVCQPPPANGRIVRPYTSVGATIEGKAASSSPPEEPPAADTRCAYAWFEPAPSVHAPVICRWLEITARLDILVAVHQPVHGGGALAIRSAPFTPAEQRLISP